MAALWAGSLRGGDASRPPSRARGRSQGRSAEDNQQRLPAHLAVPLNASRVHSPVDEPASFDAKPRNGGDSSPRSKGAEKSVPAHQIRRIMMRLDRENKGVIQVSSLLHDAEVANILHSQCPHALQELEQIAGTGSVRSQDLRRLLAGRSAVQSQARTTVESVEEEILRLPENELRCCFDTVKGENGVITISGLLQNRQMILSTYPPLIDFWQNINQNKDGKITWDELRVFNGGAAAWLEHELNYFVGLATLKDQIFTWYRSVLLDEARRNNGHDVNTATKGVHMIFQGNPGTGKTTIARVMASLLHRIGMMETTQVLEVKRADLVAGHVGQTAMKTDEAIRKAGKGVLFIDEAYQLSSTESRNDFGREAIDTLMNAMDKPSGPLMIFAGYAEDMSTFMRANAGLYRRIGYTFDFADYSPKDLAAIMNSIVSQRGFVLEASLLQDDRLATLIEDLTQPRTRSLMNGGLCERLFHLSKHQLDLRSDAKNPSLIISEMDVRTACTALTPPPDEREGKTGPANNNSNVAADCNPTMLGKPIWGPCAPPVASVPRRNVCIDVVEGENIQSKGNCCLFLGGAAVSIRLDGKEVHFTKYSPFCLGSPVFQDQRVVPYNGESLLEFAVFRRAKCRGNKFVGSGSMALSTNTVPRKFKGSVELRAMDKPVGWLHVDIRWQDIFIPASSSQDSSDDHPYGLRPPEIEVPRSFRGSD